MMGVPTLNICRGRGVRKSLLLAATALTTLAPPLAADPAAALGTQIIDVSIAPQPLADALTQFGLQSGLQISAAATVAADQYSPGVSGRMPAREALRQLMSGADVPFQFLDEDTAVLNIAEDTSGPLLLDEIIIRGELLERSLQDSPTSVAIATGDALEKRGDRDVYDFVDRAANVIQTNGDEGISIRGVNQFGINGRAASSPLISTQVDGVALPDLSSVSRSQFPNWDVEQVEILRGPQSTQQGRNALGGAIVIKTRDPIYQDEYRFRAGYANRDTYETAFSINKVLIEDRAAFRFSAIASGDDGIVSNPTLGRDDVAQNKLENWRTKLRLNPTEDLELVFSYARQESENGETRINPDLFPASRTITSDVDTYTDISTDIASLRATYSFSSNLKLEAETSYYSDDLFEILDNDRTAVDGGFSRSTGDAEVFEQDLRLSFEGNGFRGVAGLFYNDSDFTRASTAVLRGPTRPSLPGGIVLPPFVEVVGASGITTTTENFAIYGEVELDADRILPGLSFTLGARYDREDVRVRSFGDNDLNPAIPLPPLPIVDALLSPVDVSAEDDFDAFLPKLGVTYEFSPGLQTSFTYQRGYRAGGINRNVFTGRISRFDPEFTDNFELAFRGSFLEGRLTTNANLFYTSWEDQQVTIPVTSFPNDTMVVNAGESEIYGAELSVDYEVTPSFGVYATLGVLETKFEDFETPMGDNLRGNALPNAPSTTASLGFDYGFANGVSVGMDAVYSSASYANSFNTSRLDDYVVVNAQVNYERGPLLAGLYVRNLFDENYITERRLGPVAASAGDPLTVGAFVQYSF